MPRAVKFQGVTSWPMPRQLLCTTMQRRRDPVIEHEKNTMVAAWGYDHPRRIRKLEDAEDAYPEYFLGQKSIGGFLVRPVTKVSEALLFASTHASRTLYMECTRPIVLQLHRAIRRACWCCHPSRLSCRLSTRGFQAAFAVQHLLAIGLRKSRGIKSPADLHVLPAAVGI
jgi:hypothetical protein